MTFTEQQATDIMQLRSNGMSYENIAAIITGKRNNARHVASLIKADGVLKPAPAPPPVRVVSEREAAGLLPLPPFHPLAMVALTEGF
jgi:hypothetical protein